MNHDDHIGARVESHGVAGFLVGAIAAVDFVNGNGEAELTGQGSRFISAVIVHQDDVVHHIGKFPHSRRERLLGIVGRHHHNDSFAVNHVSESLS